MDINLELFKKNFWLINLVAAVLGFISIIIPCWGLIISEGVVGAFYFGSYYTIGSSGIEWRFLDEPGLLAPGNVAMILLIVGSALILVSALLSRKGGQSKAVLSLIGGIILILAPITLMIGMVIAYDEFWIYYMLSVGGIIPFIAGAFAIFSWVIVFRG
jgi:hypothetical protein